MSSPSALLSPIRSVLLIIVTAAVLGAAGLAGHSWLAAHDAALTLAVTVAAQQRVLDQAVARQEQRDEILAKTLSRISQAKNAVQTPAQAAAQIPQALPILPAPIAIEIPQPTPAEPSPPAMATVPQADLKPIYDYLQNCRACEAKLSTAESNLADEQIKVTALTAERNAAMKAARRGFWPRFKTAAKWLLIGAAAGAIAAETTRHL